MELNKEKLLAQNKNNALVRNWMWFVFICCWGLVIIADRIPEREFSWQIKTFWVIVSTLTLVFISSLQGSIKHNELLLFLINRKR
jgi:hypothetical protein